MLLYVHCYYLKYIIYIYLFKYNVVIIYSPYHYQKIVRFLTFLYLKIYLNHFCFVNELVKNNNFYFFTAHVQFAVIKFLVFTMVYFHVRVVKDFSSALCKTIRTMCVYMVRHV